jgi:hypothetical protein
MLTLRSIGTPTTIASAAIVPSAALAIRPFVSQSLRSRWPIILAN